MILFKLPNWAVCPRNIISYDAGSFHHLCFYHLMKSIRDQKMSVRQIQDTLTKKLVLRKLFYYLNSYFSSDNNALQQCYTVRNSLKQTSDNLHERLQWSSKRRIVAT